MRRLLLIAILAAGFMLSLTTQAQRRGGGMAGGRGVAGHGPGIAARGRSAPAMPAGRFAGAPRSRSIANNGRLISGRFGVNNRSGFFNGRRRCINGFNCRFFFNSGFGFGFPGFGFGYNYIPGFYPSDYDQQPQTQQPVVVSDDNEGNTELAVEIQRLSDEVSYMRQEQTRQAQARQPGSSMTAHSAETTTFVFRDGRRMTTENYAIAGETLWVFNERVAKKYSIAELDRPATEQANAENGVDIRFP